MVGRERVGRGGGISRSGISFGADHSDVEPERGLMVALLDIPCLTEMRHGEEIAVDELFLYCVLQ